MADFTKPVVQITGVEVDRGGKKPGVQIHWTAKDKNLGFRPITLFYAEQSEGPWKKIVSGVENNGQYDWQPPATAPHRLFLRVEAADLAGNVAAVQTANALRLDSLLTIAAPTPTLTSTSPAEPTHKLEPILSNTDSPRTERVAPAPLPVHATPHPEFATPPPPAMPAPEPVHPSAAILNVEPIGN